MYWVGRAINPPAAMAMPLASGPSRYKWYVPPVLVCRQGHHFTAEVAWIKVGWLDDKKVVVCPTCLTLAVREMAVAEQPQ
jgi:hypothetical protein